MMMQNRLPFRCMLYIRLKRLMLRAIEYLLFTGPVYILSDVYFFHSIKANIFTKQLHIDCHFTNVIILRCSSRHSGGNSCTQTFVCGNSSVCS